jgi:hypothetical protein
VKKISELPAATAVAAAAVLPIVQSGATEKVTVQQIAEAAQALSFAKQVSLGLIRLGG